MIRNTMLTVALASASLTALGQQVTLTGSGSTFAAPLYTKWASNFKSVNGNVQINYQGIGSGGGINQVSSGLVDFGGTDTPMNDAQLANAKSKLHTDILQFPTALGAVVPIYNIPGVTAKLNFTQDALAGIYLGKITKWNDPYIQQANPKVKLPASNIIVVHRSEGSGTTFIWTDYLSKVSPEWKSKVGAGAAVNWPVGLGGKGSEGVSGLVKQSPNSIGYVELVYALSNKIVSGPVRNAAGNFIEASLSSVTAAAAGAVKNMPADFRVSITDAPGAQTYPIASFTWMLIPRSIQDKTKAAALKQFLEWSLTKGQGDCEALTYSKLPKEVVDREAQAIGTLQY
jgi:phosphate transport system substrate-binding protein